MDSGSQGHRSDRSEKAYPPCSQRIIRLSQNFNLVFASIASSVFRVCYSTAFSSVDPQLSRGVRNGIEPLPESLVSIGFRWFGGPRMPLNMPLKLKVPIFWAPLIACTSQHMPAQGEHGKRRYAWGQVRFVRRQCGRS